MITSSFSKTAKKRRQIMEKDLIISLADLLTIELSQLDDAICEYIPEDSIYNDIELYGSISIDVF